MRRLPFVCLPFLCLLVVVHAFAPAPAWAEPPTDAVSAAETGSATVVLMVDTKRVVVPKPAGYLGLAEAPSELRDVVVDTVPPDMRAVEVLMHGGDLDLDMDVFGRNATFEIYVHRELEFQAIGAEQWAKEKGAIAEGLRGANVAGHVENNAKRADTALREHFDDNVRFEAGEPGRQVVYREDARSIRMHLLLPTRQTLLGQVHEIDVVRVVALTLVRGRMLTVVGSLEFASGQADVGLVVRQLDAYLDEIHRLNPAADD